MDFANVTLDQSNLPTSFNVTDMNNTGYKYVLQGDPNKSEKSVKMEILTVPNLGTFEMPIGDLPIFLPVSFNGKEDWMDSFGSQLQILGGYLNSINESAFFATNITISNSDITFILASQFDTLQLTNISQPLASYLDFLPEVVFEQDALLNGVSLSTNITYSKTSGILETLSLDLYSDNATVNNSTFSNQRISQNMVFAAVLPPFGSSGIIDAPFPFPIPLLAIVFILRPKRRYN